MPIHQTRTKEVGAPQAAGNPTGYVLPPQGIQNIVYRAADGNLIELWRDGSGHRGTGNVSGVVAAPKAAGDPSCYFENSTGNIVVPYRGVDGHVHTLYWATGPVGHDALSQSVNAPQTAGRPVGYYNPTTTRHLVVYRSPDGHLRALSWMGPGVAVHEDLTGGANAIKAAGDPAAYLDTKRNTNIVVYRAVDGNIRSIYWSEGPSGLDDLSGYAQAPDAAGDPVAYFTDASDTHQVTYRSTDGHIRELYCTGVAPVAQIDLTAAANAPVAGGDPTAWFDAHARLKHVVYRGQDNHLYDLRWIPGQAVSCVDLTMEGAAPQASGTPFGFSGPTYQHLTYRGVDGEFMN